jgi:hypothetical protein
VGKPGSTLPSLPAHQAIAMACPPTQGSCLGAMGPGFRRGSEWMSSNLNLFTPSIAGMESGKFADCVFNPDIFTCSRL